MNKSKLKGLEIGSAIYVITHGQHQLAMGRRFSMSYGGIRNPRVAFEVAVKDYALGMERPLDVSKINEGYNVVFCYTEEAGGYRGVMFWIGFKNKADFDGWYTPKIRAVQEIVAEGVTKERAIELVQQTPIACYVVAAMEEATDPATGYVDPVILKMQFDIIAFAMARQ